MSEDRELLELAAKAAGYAGASWFKDSLLVPHATENRRVSWNPLTDDGDALRLAVKLRLTVETAANGQGADAAAYLPGRPDVAAVEWCGFDPDNAERAIRRAIVRAAAALAKE